jgi:7-cyano-7-deazaguanine synthase
MKAVVVLSGGQDSATALAMAVRRHGAENVAAITFAYGQRHALEAKCARNLALKVFRIAAWKKVSLGFYPKVTDNALLSKDIPIGRKKGAKCPNTVVEGRNAIFLLVASVWAKSLGAKEVWIGVSEADSSGYPDCRAGFVRAQGRAIRLALDYPIRIVAPFMHMTKAQEWALADRLGILDVIEHKTLTCYNGIPGSGCGKCPACVLRNRGLAEYRASRGQK